MYFSVFYLIFLLIFLFCFSSIALAGLLLAVPVPTPQKAVEEMLCLAKVRTGDKVYDLGCGDGRIIICAAKKFQAEGRGVELSILHFLITKFNIKINKLDSKVKVFYGNLYHTDLSDASVITIFGHPSTMFRLKKKVIDKLKSGTRVVSYAFPVDDLKPQKVLKIKNYAPIYLYIIKNTKINKIIK